MKLLAVRLARTIWLFPRYFLNPKGADTRPVLEAIKAKYNFLKTPLDIPVPASGDMKFEFGSFAAKNGAVTITAMTLHADGLVVDTRSSTDDGDAFLEDVIAWVSKDYGLPSYNDLPIKRLYASELNLTLDKTPKIFDTKMASFLSEANSILGQDRGGKAEFVGFQVGPDPTLTDKAAPFRFEREINTAFEENRYYSFSPTGTAVHFKLLELLEKAIT